MLVSKNFSDLVTFARASARWRFSSGGVLVQDAANVPSLDYDPITLAARGLLIEEQRTNVIRNSSMVGAVVGVPGTLPTYWGFSTVAGLSVDVAGTGVVNGIPYIDLRISGNPGSTSSTGMVLSLEASSVVTASPGQSWASSMFVALVGGSLLNVGGIAQRIRESDGGGVFLAYSLVSAIAPTSSLTRYQGSAVLANGSTQRVSSVLTLSVTAGQAIDLTIRLGAPQLEQSAVASSPILTTTAQATRAADSAIISDLSKIAYNQTEGTFVSKFIVPPAASTAQGIFNVNDGTIANRFIAYVLSGGLRIMSAVSNVPLTINAGALPAAGSAAKIAMAYKANDFAVSVNGGAVTMGSTLGLASGMSMLRLGGTNHAAGSEAFNSCLQRLDYIPVRKTNAELQTLSA